MSKKIILFDIDYTLLDTTKLKQIIADAILKLVPHTNFAIVDGIYYEVRKKGSFKPHLFATLFKEKFQTPVSVEEIENLWWNQDILQEAIYPEVIPTLEKLQANGDFQFGIFSSGNPEFQTAKIASISHFFTSEHIHMADFKDEILPDVFTLYQTDKVFLIDDFVTVLQKASAVKKDLFSIWMKRGKFAMQEELPEGFEPNATVKNLSEVVDILNKE